MYCCPNEQKWLTSHSSQTSRQLTQWNHCFKGNLQKSHWKEVLNVRGQLDTRRNTRLSRFVSLLSLLVLCQQQQPALLPALSISLSQHFSLYLLSIKCTFSELTQRKPPTSLSNRYICADLNKTIHTSLSAWSYDFYYKQKIQNHTDFTHTLARLTSMICPFLHLSWIACICSHQSSQIGTTYMPTPQ